jgi:hypothetical protein
MNEAANLYPSPIDLPERRVGGFEIKHHYESDLAIVDFREAVMTGKSMTRHHFDPPRKITGLYDREQQGLWIADIPQEIRQHEEAIAEIYPRGRILVGGLGLGIAVTLLARLGGVEQVDAVEISPEVAELCDPHHPKVKVIVADFYEWLDKLETWPYHGAFIDIWAGTNEGTWWEDVMPIRRAIGRKFGAWINYSVKYWAEDIMLGQVGPRLMEPTPPHWYYQRDLGLPMSKKRAKWFIQNIGTPLWEKRYGHMYPVDQRGTYINQGVGR